MFVFNSLSSQMVFSLVLVDVRLANNGADPPPTDYSWDGPSTCSHQTALSKVAFWQGQHYFDLKVDRVAEYSGHLRFGIAADLVDEHTAVTQEQARAHYSLSFFFLFLSQTLESGSSSSSSSSPLSSFSASSSSHLPHPFPAISWLEQGLEVSFGWTQSGLCLNCITPALFLFVSSPLLLFSFSILCLSFSSLFFCPFSLLFRFFSYPPFSASPFLFSFFFLSGPLSP